MEERGRSVPVDSSILSIYVYKSHRQEHIDRESRGIIGEPVFVQTFIYQVYTSSDIFPSVRFTLDKIRWHMLI